MARRKAEKRGHGIPIRTEDTRDQFLTLVANGSTIKQACNALDVARSSLYKWIREDVEFKALYDQALEDSQDVIRGEIWRRAITGIRRVRVIAGKIVYEREYSDRILEMLAKMRLPEAAALNGTGVTINQTQNLIQMSDEQLEDALRQRGIPLLSIEE